MMERLYIRRNWLIKKRDKKLRELDEIRRDLRGVNQMIYKLKEGDVNGGNYK